ncbi:unnamed protein product [Cylindrotheca closterium]|uniref:SET domain-containing protein n=1 Tax=Cylindrotheca closterium TaxID=2856 RepID=A0AAD2JK54_9STRA|nr:unnamed protein product [Cylindrotheca closterium]
MIQDKLLLTVLTLTSIHQGATTSDGHSKQQHTECGIYLAPSTIPGAGLGMYAGNRDYEAGEGLTDGDLLVPIFDLDWHNDYEEYEFLWDEYTWAAKSFNGMEEEETDDPDQICVASFGMGAAVNCMLPLVNAVDALTVDDYFSEKSGLDNAGLSSESPGVGAFTPHHGRPTKARRDIPAGQELFVNYGEDYFTSREGYASVPLTQDYREADRITKRFQILIIALRSLSLSAQGDLWKLVKNSTSWNSRLQNALYDRYEDVLRNDEGGAAYRHYNTSIRSLDWLEEHGACMDHIEAGVSTVPDAGRGAFARRFIKKGDVVSPTPLIHLPDRNILTIYDAKVVLNPDDDSEHVLTRDGDQPSHQQLMLNYCFGHRDSTLLLCPYGYLSALINHSYKEPNARISWSQKESIVGHPEWLNQSLKEWGNKGYAGLSLDFVALRDIEKSEEILIDYGIEWEEAWQKHVSNFKSPRKDYIPAFELNRMADLRVKTISEYDYKYHGINMFCRRYYVVQFDSDIEVSKDWEGFEDDRNVLLGIYPCRVVERHNDNSYTVEIIDKEYASVDDQYVWPHHEVVSHILFNVPRDIFYFRDEPNHRDHHQKWSFRHDMRIPDDIFPEVWKNRLHDETTEGLEDTPDSADDDECDQDYLTCAEL